MRTFQEFSKILLKMKYFLFIIKNRFYFNLSIILKIRVSSQLRNELQIKLYVICKTYQVDHILNVYMNAIRSNQK